MPKDISTASYQLNKFLNNTPKPRQTGSGLREPQARDLLDIVYTNVFSRPANLPRTMYYLGKVPVDGRAGIYRMKDFETLMPESDYYNNNKEQVDIQIEDAVSA